MKRIVRFAPVLLILLPVLACGRGQEAIPAAEPKGSSAASAQAPPVEIRELFPPFAAAGVPFQRISDGSSTIGVAGNGFTRTSQVFFDERPLHTNYQSPKAIAAVVPNDLIASSRPVSLTVRDRNPDRRSAPVTFQILPPKKEGEPAVIKELFPPAAQAGKGFGIQPDGSWALGVAGTGFDSNCVVVFDGVDLPTVFQSPVAMVAFLPPALAEKPRKVKVVVRSSDPAPASKPSAASVFEVKP